MDDDDAWTGEEQDDDADERPGVDLCMVCEGEGCEDCNYSGEQPRRPPYRLNR